MVFVYREDSKGVSYNRVFDGSDDVPMFIFSFKTVAMLGKKEKQKASVLLNFLKGFEFVFFVALQRTEK